MPYAVLWDDVEGLLFSICPHLHCSWLKNSFWWGLKCFSWLSSLLTLGLPFLVSPISHISLSIHISLRSLVLFLFPLYKAKGFQDLHLDLDPCRLWLLFSDKKEKKKRSRSLVEANGKILFAEKWKEGWVFLKWVDHHAAIKMGLKKVPGLLKRTSYWWHTFRNMDLGTGDLFLP